jgi:hypothetical protein
LIGFEFLYTVKLAVNGTWLEGNPVFSGKRVQFGGSFNSPSGICIKLNVPATEKNKSCIPCRSVIGRHYPTIYSSVEQLFFCGGGGGHKVHLKMFKLWAGSKPKFNSKSPNCSGKIYIILSD